MTARCTHMCRRAGIIGAVLAVAIASNFPHSLSTTAEAAERAMIAAANRHAAEAGLEILQAGGSAIDAAIAAQMVLGLVEPQSSGIGGGGFLVLPSRTQVGVKLLAE